MQMDTSKNLFRDQFDVITSFNSLHWVKDQVSALRGIARAVIENGKIILLLSHKKSQYHHTLDTLCSQEKWSHYFKDYLNPRSFFEVKEYDTLLKEAGLDIASLNEREMTHHFDTVEKLKEFLGNSMANIKQIPQDKKNEFLDDFCKEFFDLLECKNSTNIAVSFWCLEVLASKPVQTKKAGPFFRSKL
jgi:SAM-dependent methyltransferase